MVRLVRWGAAAALALGLGAAPVLSATLVVDGGSLVGAEGVEVGGALYNVSFENGTCEGLFNGCDASTSFGFSTAGDAEAAVEALLAQVFLDTPSGAFDSAPDMTEGCTEPTLCRFLVPFAFEAVRSGMFDAFQGYNFDEDDRDRVGGGVFTTLPDFDFGDVDVVTYAVFEATPTAPVPLPGGATLLLTALGGVWLRRHARIGGNSR